MKIKKGGNMTLEERIGKILDDSCMPINLVEGNRDKATQAILTLIGEETVKARMEELERIKEANRDNGINFWFEDMKPQNNGWRNMKQYAPERIAQLQAELEQV